MTTFRSFQLHPSLLKAIEDSGFSEPTPVQKKSIPPILKGVDVMACAQTGTGKTAAFTLPLAHRLLSMPPGRRQNSPRALVLTPTRELADQVRSSIRTFVKGSLQTGLVVGGMPYGPQVRMLQKPLDILVATPGRLIDHLEEGYADLSQVEILVLDEADRMLDMGFLKPVERIIERMSPKRQTLLFSATFDNAIEKLAKKFLDNPVEVRLAAATQKHESIKQSMFYATDKEHKAELLQTLLEDGKIWQAIVFMRTKHAADRMAKKISSWGHDTAALHGDMRQNVRKRVIEQMHKGKLRVLVATDVAARGLDVKDLTHVVNFDLPQVAEDYIHRIGRTGRAGAEGVAVSFVSREEFHLLRGIEKLLGQKIEAENENPKGYLSDKKPDNSGKKKRTFNRGPQSFAKSRSGSQQSYRAGGRRAR